MLLFMPITSHLNGPLVVAKDANENKVKNPEEAKLRYYQGNIVKLKPFAIAMNKNEHCHENHRQLEPCHLMA